MEQQNAGKMRNIHEVGCYSRGLHKGKKEAEIGIKEIVFKNGVRGDM